MKKKVTKTLKLKGNTPAEMAKIIPWDKLTGCAMVYEMDGLAHIHITDMPWLKRVWLCKELDFLNACESMNARLLQAQKKTG